VRQRRNWLDPSVSARIGAVLNGDVTEGPMVGARVRVTFQVITPCTSTSAL
jgi:hypothetical protein